MQRRTPVLLTILDGWGLAPPGPGNAPFVADTPNMDCFTAEFPFTRITAHNGPVGLPPGQMGNSEVGHLNIGAGRVVYQDFTRINKAIEDASFAANTVLNTLFDQVAAQGRDGRLHLLGLLSDGGVHSHINHLRALLQLAARKQLQQVFIHCFMDGRDTPPDSGRIYMLQLEEMIREIGCGQIATVIGRYWIMDRDKRWDRVEKGWKAMMQGEGRAALQASQAVEEAYKAGESDEFIKPVVLHNASGAPVATINDGDSLFFFNFRADRVRQLCHALTDADFSSFDVSARPQLRHLVTMTEYEADFPFPVAFPPQSMQQILGEVIAAQGLRQLRIAETEKYAHVTYFFNGGQEQPNPQEERVLIASPRDVATYDLKPEMSAVQITDTLLRTLQEAEAAGHGYDLIVLNFANGDMVGHTGVLDAAVKACATVDSCLGRIREFFRERGWIMLITADHGNCELMIDPQTRGPHTAHTTNPVPFIVVADQLKQATLKEGGALRDIAPTVLHLMGLAKPAEMDGENLLLI